MKTFAIALCAAAMAATAALPAIAQPGVWSIEARLNAVQQGIDKGVGDGALDRAQHDKVQFELNTIRKRTDDYRRTHGGQLSPDAEQKIEVDLDAIINQIHWTRANEWRRPW
jgi:hypothetical protein